MDEVEDYILKPLNSSSSASHSNSSSNNKSSNETNHQGRRTHKTELQLLRLSDEAQEKVMDTLKSIYGPDFKLNDKSSYTDRFLSLKKSYWQDRGRLIVQGISSNVNTKNSNEDDTKTRLRKFALLKLLDYGFAENHCEEALDSCNCNIDEALSLLYSKYIKRSDRNENTESVLGVYNPNELLEMREDEKQALESIYDTRFTEKEKDHIWLLKLDVDYLLQFSPKKSKELQNYKKLANTNSRDKNKNKCRNFSKGFCKFGDKCRFSHEIEEKITNFKDDEVKEFFLEIRFPKDSCYPHEAPMVFLKTTYDDIPKKILLQINRKLYQEAQQIALDGMSSIYTLFESLQQPEEIQKYLSEAPDDFPSENKSLFYSSEENSILSANTEYDKNLPSHYQRGSTGASERTSLSLEHILKDDQILARKFIDKCDNCNYSKMLHSRKNLPAWNEMVRILDTISMSQVIVISGETGCGKSTQVPQFILDNWLLNVSRGNVYHNEIICTQPRRLSAIGVAERVAAERCDRIGNMIGYQIRLENKISSNTRLIFCTTGILLQRLQSDPFLKSVSHIIVDEVHERSEESDFLLLILKDILRERKDLKVILMSATLNADLFSRYFGSSVPVIEIPGRTFPVEQIFLEEILDRTNFVLEQDSIYCRKLKKEEQQNLENDFLNFDVQSAANHKPPTSTKDENLGLGALYSRYSDHSRQTCKTLYLIDPKKVNPILIESVLNYIVYSKDHDWPKEGTILVFLPGFAEIQSVYDSLCDSSTFSPRYGKFIIIPLHSTLSSEEQTKIFEKVPHGKRKIVLSTNIAETSITIDDCVFVIDCGLMKEKRFDSNKNMESLDLVWESRANAQQRKGRAGRVMPGICIHLFTSNRYKCQFISQPVPEILRVPLEQLILRIKTLRNFDGSTVNEVIARLIEPPDEENVYAAAKRLQSVGALDQNCELTALGHHLSALPVDVRIGKLLLFGAIFQCLDSVLTIASCLSHKSPFVSPFDKRMLAEQKKRTFAIQSSDHLTFLNAYRKWNEVCKKSRQGGRYYADENFLSYKTLELIAEVKYQFLELLITIGFVPINLPKRRKMSEDRILELTGDELNCNNTNNRLITALLCAALYPNIVKVLTPEKNYIMTAGGAIPQEPKPKDLLFKIFDGSESFVSIHPSSVNSNCVNFLSPFLIYQEKIKTYKIFIRECTVVPLLPLVLFSGSDFKIKLNNGDFIILMDNDWIMLKSQNHVTAEMIQCLRNELSKLLEEKIKDPCLNLLNHKHGKKILSTIMYLLTRES